GLLAVLGAGRHDVDLGEALPAVLALAGAVLRRVRQPDGDDPGPLAAVEDLRHLALALLAPGRVDERGDRVHAHGLFGRDAQELLGAQAPLIDEAVGADGERGDLDVVVHGAGRAALPHRVGGRGIASGEAVRGLRQRAARRVLGSRGLRWYLARAN